MSLAPKTIAFLGSGNMAFSIVSGLMDFDYPKDNIIISGRNAVKLSLFSDQLKVATTDNNIVAAQDADVIVLCVKPTQLHGLCEEIKYVVSHHNKLVISVAAGVSLELLSDWLVKDAPIIRAMPNTPSAIAAGATALCASSSCNENQREFTESLFRSLGLTFWLQDDSLMHVATALAGSGPAYVFLMMEALSKAGIEAGLSPNDSALMTKQMVLGAAKMAMESTTEMSQLRMQVTSKGGTTERAIAVLQQGGFEQLLQDAIDGACERSKEIGQQLKEV